MVRSFGRWGDRRRRRKRKEIIVPDNEVEKEMGEVCGSGDGYLNHVKQFYVTNTNKSSEHHVYWFTVVMTFRYV